MLLISATTIKNYLLPSRSVVMRHVRHRCTHCQVRCVGTVVANTGDVDHEVGAPGDASAVGLLQSKSGTVDVCWAPRLLVGDAVTTSGRVRLRNRCGNGLSEVRASARKRATEHSRHRASTWRASANSAASASDLVILTKSEKIFGVAHG